MQILAMKVDNKPCTLLLQSAFACLPFCTCICLCCSSLLSPHGSHTVWHYALHVFLGLLIPDVGPDVKHMCALAEERDTTNPVADDMDACKELYEMTMEIVGKKDPDVLKLAMPV